MHDLSIEPRPYRLLNEVKHYAWGTRAEEAFIPGLLGGEPEMDLPYAELWMGAHPNAPSRVTVGETTVPLDRLAELYPRELLGDAVFEAFSGKWPFLFKVLSAAEPLSIQAHPNRDQALRLHRQKPEQYFDVNHKPEIVIVLDHLTAWAGFKPYAEIKRMLENYSEIAAFIGDDAFDRFNGLAESAESGLRDGIRDLYRTLLERSAASPRSLENVNTRMRKRFDKHDLRLGDEERLFAELSEKYTGSDAGLLSIFFLQMMELSKGQSIFIEAGIPHAYIRGNVVECMANSDNVVRLGLTRKATDLDAMIEILTVNEAPVPIQDPGAVEEAVYQSPATEFRVRRFQLSPGSEKDVQTCGRPAILLMTRGGAEIRWKTSSDVDSMPWHTGQSILIPALLRSFRLAPSESLEMYMAEVPDPKTAAAKA